MSRGRLQTAACLLIAAAWVSAAPAGCASDPTAGYSTLSTFPQGYATVAVPIFENTTFHRNLEFDLADALIKEIEARTPYKVVPNARADTILTGRITDVEIDQLSKSRQTGLSEEVVLGVTIDFEWKDARTGEILQARREFATHALFVPSPPSGEPIEFGEFAVIQRIASDVVDEMRARW